MRESLTGNLLVASSVMEDPICGGGVCLVVHHDESNVIGVMLNRPMKPSAEALLAMLDDSNSSPSSEPSDSEPSDSELSDSESSDAVSSPSPGNRLAENDFGVGAKSISSEGDLGSTAGKDESPASPWRMLHFGGPLSGPVVAIHQVSQLAEAETGSGIYVAAQKDHLENLLRRPSSPYRLIVGHLGWESTQLEKEIEAGMWHVVPATTETVFSSASEMWPRLIRRATSNSLAKWIGVVDVVGAGELN